MGKAVRRNNPNGQLQEMKIMTLPMHAYRHFDYAASVKTYRASKSASTDRV